MNHLKLGKLDCRVVIALAGLLLAVSSVPGEGSDRPHPSPQHSLRKPLPSQPPPPLLDEHSLSAVARLVHTLQENMEKIQDYSTTLVKRERIKGKLAENEYMFVKVRHKPFSVYLYFLGPHAMKGREAVYVEGQNDGKMWTHQADVQDSSADTLSLAPDGMIAMRGQRYPLTELDILGMMRRLLKVAEENVKEGECEVKSFRGVMFNGRTCTAIQIVHPVRRCNLPFHLARIFVDDELNVIVRYEAHDWPKKAGGPPQLIEEYTYLNLKLNNGFSDRDFDVSNPNYRFR